ncbi:DUF4245 domain-containing protein [Microbispora sp. RL4-1S]|uniref:DUF4245 domain-containing protein n=1 Tax=Microbispora oryzae TaxID=2806554 RepID=A0A940WU16_9ACTN|nr:DUF4245 domain-containing protein [Microbispora oryzae]MBP2707121.1 DUF4245 domain-containing protein [Microbispora oryzae]
MGRFTQGAAGYGYVLVVCLVGLALFALVTPHGRVAAAPPVDYSADRAGAAGTAPYPVVAPREVPPGWTPESSILTRDGGAVTWRLGFATRARTHALVAQSDERPPAGFADRMANTERVSGSRVIGGVSWEERVRPDKDQRSLVRVLPDHAIVVTGTADWDDLTALAGALVAQPPIR